VRVSDSDREVTRALIPLTSGELFGHPEVEAWLRSVTDEPIADLAHALGGEKPEIDCLVLSGRASQFPPVRARLLAALERHLGIAPARLREARLAPTERKAAVGLGALYYGLVHRHVRLTDRSIWGRYGVVFETARGPRFLEFFSHATRLEPERGDRVVVQHGVSQLRLSRTHAITRSGGGVTVVVTFSRDPDADLKLRDAFLDGRFTVVKTLGSDVLGTGLRPQITLAVDDDDRLKIIVEADGRRHELDAKPVPTSAPLPPQWTWPFMPLRDPVPFARPGDEAPPATPRPAPPPRPAPAPPTPPAGRPAAELPAPPERLALPPPAAESDRAPPPPAGP
jgi:hypothetical protein